MYDTNTLLDNLETRELVLGNSTTTGGQRPDVIGETSLHSARGQRVEKE